jgi:hypothetical protein
VTGVQTCALPISLGMTNPDSHNVPYGLKGMVITATGNMVQDEFFEAPSTKIMDTGQIKATKR